MPAVRRTRAIELFWKTHPWLYRVSGGRILRKIQVGAREIRVRAREAEGAERERLWSSVLAQDASFAEYERRTTRRIPVVVLEPTAKGPA